MTNGNRRLGLLPFSPNGLTASVGPITGGPGFAWFPLLKHWPTLVTAYTLFSFALLLINWATHSPKSLWTHLSALTIPFTHLGSFALIAPLPWIFARRFRSPWRYTLGFILSLIVCEFTAALLPLIDTWIRNHGEIKFNLKVILVLLELYMTMVGPGMMVVGGLVEARAHSEELRRASEAEAQIAKNRLLQGQIHPHVLFNALNGLAELIHKCPKDAENAVRHLSDLLRRIMRASEHMRLPLGEEKKIITDYLALESIRLGTRLQVVWEWDLTLDNIEVPPLLIQPMVENAIKHGIAPSVSGGEIVLRARVQDGAIMLEVWNSGEPLQPNENHIGIGVNNLRSRLSLHFGTGAIFSLVSSGNGTLAGIRIDVVQVECRHEACESPSSR